MKLLVNASNITSPGAVILARNIVSSILRICSSISITVIEPHSIDIVNETNVGAAKIIRVKRFDKFNVYQRLWFEFGSFKSMVRKESPDVVLALGNVSPVELGVPTVTLLQQSLIAGQVYRLPKQSLQYWNVKVNRWMFRRTVSHVHSVIAQLPFIKDEIISNYEISPQRVVIIPNGVSDRIHRISEIEVSASDQDEPLHLRLLYPSAFYRYKNQRLILDVGKILQREGVSNVKFMITANSSNVRARSILNFVNRHRLETIVQNVGMLSEEKLAELYSEATALFFPSLAESFGNPLLEAAAFGLPVLAADLPYAHDVMGDAALYFDPHSPESALDAINQLRDPEIRAELSRKSRKRFEESPSWDDIARMYLEVLKDAAASAKK